MMSNFVRAHCEFAEQTSPLDTEGRPAGKRTSAAGSRPRIDGRGCRTRQWGLEEHFYPRSRLMATLVCQLGNVGASFGAACMFRFVVVEMGGGSTFANACHTPIPTCRAQTNVGLGSLGWPAEPSPTEVPHVLDNLITVYVAAVHCSFGDFAARCTSFRGLGFMHNARHGTLFLAAQSQIVVGGVLAKGQFEVDDSISGGDFIFAPSCHGVGTTNSVQP